MSVEHTAKDLALMTAIDDLFALGRLCDLDIQNEEGLDRLETTVAGLRADSVSASLLAIHDPKMTLVDGSFASYNDVTPATRAMVAQRLIDRYQPKLDAGCVLSQESMADFIHTPMGKIAVKVGLTAATIATVGVYKRQLIELLSDAITNASLMKTKWADADLRMSQKLRGSSDEVVAKLHSLKKILSDVDALQELTTVIASGKSTAAGARAALQTHIGSLIKEGVPIGVSGEASLSKASKTGPLYTVVDTDDGNWNETTLSGVITLLKEVERAAQAHLADSVSAPPSGTKNRDLRLISLRAKRASVRAMHHVLYVLRRTTQVLDNVRFVYHLK